MRALILDRPGALLRRRLRSSAFRLPPPALAASTLGPLIFGLGIVLNLQANVGLGPWPALSYGTTLHLPISYGQANILIGVVMVAVAWALGVRPGPGTLLNITLPGLAADLVLALGLVPMMSGGLDGYAMLLLSVQVHAVGTAIYVKSGLGAGPRDSVMLGLATFIAGRVGLARNFMDCAATLCGWLLGAPIGLGTVIFALALGPCVAAWFRLFRVKVKRSRCRPLADPAPVRLLEVSQ
jgi:uncharacterized protein